VRISQSDQCRELLEWQGQVIARWQAADIGADPAALDAELRRGRWQPLYRGVYAAYTGPPTRRSLLWAAVLRAGPGAGLSHRTAAELDRLTDERPGLIEVSVPAGRQVSVSRGELGTGVPRIVVRRSARLPGALQPGCNPPRTRTEETVLDLAQQAAAFDDALHWAIAGCARGRTSQEKLLAAMAARPRMRWRRELTGALDEVGAGVHSLLEFRYVREVERPHGLPVASRQARAQRESRSQYLDNLYEDFGVAVELDGRAAHRAEDRWRDVHRDNYFAAVGVVTLRYSWGDVTERPCWVAEEISRVLRARGWTGGLARCGPACGEPRRRPREASGR
jgi:hypothetical protein